MRIPLDQIILVTILGVACGVYTFQPLFAEIAEKKKASEQQDDHSQTKTT